MEASPTPQVDPARIEQFLGRIVTDLGAAGSCSLTLIGIRLGLYRELAKGPLTSSELAARTGTRERYVREWLLNQAAGGYVELQADTGRYALPPEHAAVLLEDGPASACGGFMILSALGKAVERIETLFTNGGGMAWGEHDASLFSGTEAFFRTTYRQCLVQEWIPALHGVKEKLEKGARVADVGCGHGASTILLAHAFPRSAFRGFDAHGPSIEHARAAAHEAGVGDRARFETATAQDFGGGPYDLTCFFDCLHDMGEPGAALQQARKTLDADGTVMIVEPMAGRKPEENFNPVGRLYSVASVLCCTPNAVATGRTHLGTCASDEALEEIARGAGFSRFRRAWESPFNRVFEARP